MKTNLSALACATRPAPELVNSYTLTQPTVRAPFPAPNTTTSVRQSASSARVIRISFDVHEFHAPALRSAVEALKNEIGQQLTGPSSYAREQALTDAAIGVGAFLAALVAKGVEEDPHYAR